MSSRLGPRLPVVRSPLEMVIPKREQLLIRLGPQRVADQTTNYLFMQEYVERLCVYGFQHPMHLQRELQPQG